MPWRSEDARLLFGYSARPPQAFPGGKREKSSVFRLFQAASASMPTSRTRSATSTMK
jgi:hypothetical protein